MKKYLNVISLDWSAILYIKVVIYRKKYKKNKNWFK